MESNNEDFFDYQEPQIDDYFNRLVNEIFTNSIKYAFPLDRVIKENKLIRITMKKNTDNEILLTMEDNGIGIPQNINIESTESLGLHLVNILVKDQLDGQLFVDRNNGSKFLIKFKV